jgi:hypothetical protein
MWAKRGTPFYHPTGEKNVYNLKRLIQNDDPHKQVAREKLLVVPLDWRYTTSAERVLLARSNSLARYDECLERRQQKTKRMGPLGSQMYTLQCAIMSNRLRARLDCYSLALSEETNWKPSHKLKVFFHSRSHTCFWVSHFLFLVLKKGGEPFKESIA